MSDLLKPYRVEQCRESRRVFVATDKHQVEIQIGDYGIEVQITQGNDVVAECSVDHE